MSFASPLAVTGSPLLAETVFLGEEIAGNIGNVVAVIGRLGHSASPGLKPFARAAPTTPNYQSAHRHRYSKPRHRIALRFEQGRQSIAECALTTMTDMQRPN